MKLYHIITKYSMLLAVLMIAVFFVNPAKAANSFAVYDFLGYDNLYHFHCSTMTEGQVNNVSSDPVNQLNFFESKHTISGSFYLTPYNASSLYSSGHCRLVVDIPLTFSSDFALYNSSFSYNIEVDNNEGSSVIVNNVHFRYGEGSPYITFTAYCFLDNFYSFSTRNTFASSFTLNLTFSCNLGVDPPSSVYSISYGNPSFENPSISISKGALPQVTSGLAGVIAEAVSFGIYNSSLDDLLVSANSQLNSANTNLGSLISVLNSIKAQDLSLYNEIISKIVAQTQNDTALQQAFMSFMEAQLYGSATYGLDSNMSLHIEGPIGDMVSHIWYQVIDFKTKFQQFVAANQSEAAEVNSEAASQESALSDLQDSLVVPTPAVDGILNDLASDIANPGISSGQGDVFFYLRNPYLVKILVFVFSIGLAGFILYGKG